MMAKSLVCENHLGKNMDPIGDMMNSLKTAARAGKTGVLLPLSEFKFAIAKLLEQEGFIKGVAKTGKKNRKFIQCELVYQADQPKIVGVKRISKPSRRLYIKHRDLAKLNRGRGVVVLSTPAGLKTGKAASEAKVGGELMFTIWS